MRLRCRTTSDSVVSQQSPSAHEFKAASPKPMIRASAALRKRRGLAPRKRLGAEKENKTVNKVVEENEGEDEREDGADEMPAPAEVPQVFDEEVLHEAEAGPAPSSLPPSSEVPWTLPSSSQTRRDVYRVEPSQQLSSNSQASLDYEKEPSYQPDPDDPFGFLAAERKIQQRRKALQPLGDSNIVNKRKSLRQSTKLVLAKLDVESDEDEGDEENLPKAFATPARPRKSTRRSSVRIDSSPEPVRRTRPRRGQQKSDSPKDVTSPTEMTTLELEQLLPKRSAASKRRPVMKKHSTAAKENRTVKGSRKARGPKKRDSDDEQEIVDIDLGEKQLKARQARQQKLDDLADYKLETETVIWL